MFLVREFSNQWVKDVLIDFKGLKGLFIKV